VSTYLNPLFSAVQFIRDQDLPRRGSLESTL
jgi:hypothetical protein